MEIKEINLSLSLQEFYELYQSVIKDSRKPQSTNFATLVNKLIAIDKRIEMRNQVFNES